MYPVRISTSLAPQALADNLRAIPLPLLATVASIPAASGAACRPVPHGVRRSQTAPKPMQARMIG